MMNLNRVGEKPMTNSRRSFRAFQERLAQESNKPFLALGKALLLAFVGFNLLMGFMLGTVPLARNVYFHFIFHIWEPLKNWFAEMGWEGQVTLFALHAAFTIAVFYIVRNYLALAFRACWMNAVDIKNWFDRNVRKATSDFTNVAPLRRSKYEPPTQRDSTQDTAVIGG